LGEITRLLIENILIEVGKYIFLFLSKMKVVVTKKNKP